MMLQRRARLGMALLLCAVSFAGSSCAVRRRVISRLGAKPNQPLLTADPGSLVAYLNRQYEAVKNFTATVDMTPALGSAEENKVTEYKDVRAYILFRKPAAVRIVGLFPVIRTTAFDMVSDGADFKLSVPSKNRFITGLNAVQTPSANRLENLRPQHFVDALLVPPPDLDRVMIENFTDEEDAFFILHEVEEKNGALLLRRNIWFSRVNLTIARQMIFDDAGNILSDARYSDWQNYNNVGFPKHIEVNRPRDGYGLVVDLVKMEINTGVPDAKFVLDQPAGSTLQVVGRPAGSAPAGSASPPRK